MVQVCVLLTVFSFAYLTNKVTGASVPPPHPYNFQFIPNNSSYNVVIQWTKRSIANPLFPYPFIATGNRTLDTVSEGGNFNQRLSYNTNLSEGTVKQPKAILTLSSPSKTGKENRDGSKEAPILVESVFQSSSASTPVFGRGTGMKNIEMFTGGTKTSAKDTDKTPRFSEVSKLGSTITSVTSVEAPKNLIATPAVPQIVARQYVTNIRGSPGSEKSKVGLDIKNSIAEEKSKTLTEAGGSKSSANIIELLTPQNNTNASSINQKQNDKFEAISDAGNSNLENSEDSSSSRYTTRGLKSEDYNKPWYIKKLIVDLMNISEYVLASKYNLSLPGHSSEKSHMSNDSPQSGTLKVDASNFETLHGGNSADHHSPINITGNSIDSETVNMKSFLVNFFSSLTSCLKGYYPSFTGNDDIAICIQSGVIRMIDAVLKTRRIEVARGVAFIKQENTQEDKSLKKDPVELENVVLLHDWLTAVFDGIGQFFRLYSLEFNFKELELNTEVSGRGHHHYRRVFPIIVTTYMIMSTFLIPLGFQFMAMLGGKALVLSKLAFLWSMMGSSRRVFPYPETYGAGHPEFPHPSPAYYRAAHRKDFLH